MSRNGGDENPRVMGVARFLPQKACQAATVERRACFTLGASCIAFQSVNGHFASPQQEGSRVLPPPSKDKKLPQFRHWSSPPPRPTSFEPLITILLLCAGALSMTQSTVNQANWLLQVILEPLICRVRRRTDIRMTLFLGALFLQTGTGAGRKLGTLS